MNNEQKLVYSYSIPLAEYAELGSLYDYLRHHMINFRQILLWSKQIALGKTHINPTPYDHVIGAWSLLTQWGTHCDSSLPHTVRAVIVSRLFEKLHK